MAETPLSFEITELPIDDLKKQLSEIDSTLRKLLENAVRQREQRNQLGNLLQSGTEIFLVRVKLLVFHHNLTKNGQEEKKLMEHYQKLCDWFHQFETDIVDRYQHQEKLLQDLNKDKNVKLMSQKPNLRVQLELLAKMSQNVTEIEFILKKFSPPPLPTAAE